MAEEKKTEKVAEVKAEAKTEAPVAQAPAAPPVAPEPVAALPSRLDTLRGRAEVMGVPYLPSDTEETLQARLREAVEGAQKEPAAQALGSADGALRQKIYNEAMVLVRCRIVCMNPQKADLPGEIFTVSNRYLGEVKRYIPYSEQPDGWHVEKIILDMLKEKQFQQVRVRKGANNQQLPDTRWVREFAIEELPPLTQEELKVLANKQAAEAGLAIN